MAFARQGSRVAFVDIAVNSSHQLVEDIVALGLPTPWFKPCDVRDVSSLQTSIAEAVKCIGDFEVLVNNVASDDRHTLLSVTVEYWDERMAINQRSAFFAIQSVVPGMKRLGGGAIVNLGSVSWQVKNPDFPCYTIAKSSVNGHTRGLAADLGRDRIRINTVSPGWVMTERQIELWLDDAGEQQLRERQCLPDLLQGEDVARMALFLSSDDGSMCTGQEYTVDAGLS